jgi:glutamine phosphoribosylpyrophosphate amidotransferase
MQMCPLPGPLYTVLMGYKEAPVAEARARFGPIVRSLTAAFLRAHEDCIAALVGGRPDFVLPVPSTVRPGGSPIARIPGLAADVESALPGVRWTGLLCRTSEPVGHMRPSARAFAVPPTLRCRVADRRLILLDDTYVSGARSQSAAAALRRAGACSVVVVCLGRVLRPDRVQSHANFLSRRQPGNSDSLRADASGPCARCVQTPAGTV